MGEARFVAMCVWHVFCCWMYGRDLKAFVPHIENNLLIMKKIFLLCFLIAAALSSSAQMAKFQALYLLQFAKNTSWPQEDNGKPFVITVVSDNDLELEVDFAFGSIGSRINIANHRLDTQTDKATCHCFANLQDRVVLVGYVTDRDVHFQCHCTVWSGNELSKWVELLILE